MLPYLAASKEKGQLQKSNTTLNALSFAHTSNKEWKCVFFTFVLLYILFL